MFHAKNIDIATWISHWIKVAVSTKLKNIISRVITVKSSTMHVCKKEKNKIVPCKEKYYIWYLYVQNVPKL